MRPRRGICGHPAIRDRPEIRDRPVRPSANSRARVPWGRWEGAVPGYPAAAARLVTASHNFEKTLTNSRPTHGRLKAKSGPHVRKRSTRVWAAVVWGEKKRTPTPDPDTVGNVEKNLISPVRGTPVHEIAVIGLESPACLVELAGVVVFPFSARSHGLGGATKVRSPASAARTVMMAVVPRRWRDRARRSIRGRSARSTCPSSQVRRSNRRSRPSGTSSRDKRRPAESAAEARRA